MALIKYDGNWSPEPGAWPRFGARFQQETGMRLAMRPADPAEVKVGTFILAALTGTDERIPNDAALAPIAAFLREGGTLVVDSCGGSGAFTSAIQAWLAKLSPDLKLEPLAPNHPILTQSVPGAVALPAEQLRLYAIDQIGRGGTRLRTGRLGKGLIIFSPLDLTSGLLSTSTWGILGYKPEYSEALMKNIVLVTSAALK